MVKSEWFSLSRLINKKLSQFIKKNIGDQTINNSTAQKLCLTVGVHQPKSANRATDGWWRHQPLNKWSKQRLPNYDEYWEIAKNDKRTIVSENRLPISEIDKVNIVGNVWDITENENNELVRLAGGSLFYSENNCHGTIKERELFVDKETGNLHNGFSVIKL